MPHRFDFESLDVFRTALEASDVLDDIADSLPARRSSLADQIRRAGSSIALNIAEGAGEWARFEKGRFYRYAKRSATECAGAVVYIEYKKLVGRDKTDPARELLFRLVAMLISLVKNCGKKRGPEGEARPEAG